LLILYFYISFDYHAKKTVNKDDVIIYRYFVLCWI